MHKKRGSENHNQYTTAFFLRLQSIACMAELFDAMIERQVEAGEVIIHQGDDGDNFYVVDRGHFEVTIWNAGEFPRGRLTVGVRH